MLVSAYLSLRMTVGNEDLLELILSSYHRPITDDVEEAGIYKGKAISV